jgi:Fe-S-cluster containining protein
MELDCLTCGACCKVFAIVEIAADDRIPLDLVQPTGLGYAMMRLKPNSFECVCLEADNRCAIYESRPGVCRRFAVGSDLCHLARWKAGIEQK